MTILETLAAAASSEGSTVTVTTAHLKAAVKFINGIISADFTTAAGKLAQLQSEA